jgi:hypothetical protein
MENDQIFHGVDMRSHQALRPSRLRLVFRARISHRANGAADQDAVEDVRDPEQARHRYGQYEPEQFSGFQKQSPSRGAKLHAAATAGRVNDIQHMISARAVQ